MTLSIKRFVAILAASLILVGLVAVAAGVLTFRASTRVATTLTEFESHAAAKSDMIADLRRALGYGGMIHQFKNMVLRSDAERIEIVHAAAKAATQAVQTYRDIGVNAEEATSLQAIESTIKMYEANADVAERMIKDGKTPREIDQVVKIDDGPALAGFAKLDDYVHTKRQASAADIHATVESVQTFVTGTTVATVLLLAGTIAAFLLFAHARLLQPMAKLGDAMGRLATGATDVAIPGSDRPDEFGAMAKTVQIFKDNAVEKLRLETAKAAENDRKVQRAQRMNDLTKQFEGRVGGIINMVSAASVQLEAAAGTLTRTAESTQQLSGKVASASEASSSNVQTVASASQMMTSSVEEIARQVHESSKIATEAVKQAEETDTRIAELSRAASRIGDVVKLITAIAQQTNLLALNATIEAARAGEAGKGFAVVAQEVKALASQTAKATEEIGNQINGMQSATQDSVAAIKGIGATITHISEIAATIAAAIEEQGQATQEIARNVQLAAHGTAQVASNITDVNRGAMETGNASEQVLSSARSLSTESDHLKIAVEKFLSNVRAA
jgi:methyl-accepting chemotaxis protein